MKSLTDRTLTALVWQFGSKALEAGGRVAIMIVLARLLSPYEFGVAGAALVIVSLSFTLTQLGVGPALVQRQELEPRHLSTAFTCSLFTGALGGVAIWSASGIVSTFFRMPELLNVTRAIAFCFPLAAPAMVAEALLMRNLQFSRLAWVDSASFAIGYAFVGIGLAIAGAGLWSLVAAQLCQIGLRSAVLMWQSRAPMTLRVDRRAMQELLKFGVGHTLAELGNFAALQVDNIIVGRVLGAPALGLYSRAYALVTQPARLLGLVFDRVLFPAMSHAQGDDSRLQRAQRRALSGIAFVMVPVSGILIINGPLLIPLLFGAKWVGMVAPFQVLAVSLVFRTSYKVCDSVVRARGASYIRATAQWTYAIAVGIGALIGSRYGITAVAAGVSFAIILNYTVMLVISCRIISQRPADVIFIYARALALSLPAFAASCLVVRAGAELIWMPSILILFSSIFVALITFSVTAFLVPGLVKEERDWVLGMFKGTRR